MTDATQLFKATPAFKKFLNNKTSLFGIRKKIWDMSSPMITCLSPLPKRKIIQSPAMVIIPDINSSSGTSSPPLEAEENEKEKLSEDVGGGDKLSRANALDERYQAKVLIAKKKKRDYQRAYTLKNKDKVYAKNKEYREMKKAQRMAATMEQESREFISSSDSDDDEKELDAPKNAIDPFMKHYMNSSAKTVALCGKHFSEQVFQFSELTKQCATAAEMEICLNKIKRLYGIFGGTATQCIESAKSFMESTNQESLSLVDDDDAFGEVTTTTPTFRALGPENKISLLENRKRKRSILEKNLLLKKSKYEKGIYTVEDIEYLMNCQIEYSPWLLAAKDDEGDYFAMTHLIKLMATKLKRSITGLTRFLRSSKLRLADNEKADPTLIEKMQATGLYPWPFPSQQSKRAHMLHNILKM